MLELVLLLILHLIVRPLLTNLLGIDAVRQRLYKQVPLIDPPGIRHVKRQDARLIKTQIKLAFTTHLWLTVNRRDINAHGPVERNPTSHLPYKLQIYQPWSDS